MVKIRTWDEALRSYLVTPKGNNELRYLEKLDKHLRGKRLSVIDQDTVHALAYKLYPGCKPQTVNRQAIGPVLAVLHHAHRQDNSVPWSKIQMLPEVAPEVITKKPERVMELIESAVGELRVLLMVLVYQGWRITETLELKRYNISNEEPSVNRWVSKSQEWVRTPLNPAVWEALLSLPKNPDGLVFSYHNRWNVYREIDKLCDDYRPHQSRRGFATALSDLGFNIKDIAAAGAWKDERSAARYVNVDYETAQRAVLALGTNTKKNG